MKPKGAIIYISSNQEEPKFEARIMHDIITKRNGLPIYSVTQKPLNMGINKCIGDVGVSGFNFCRQLQMVVEMVEEDYVISCEADCIYSPDYFQFVPPILDAVYRNTNNYVIPYGQKYYLHKKSQTAYQVAGRKFLLDRLNFLLKGQPQWSTELKNFPKEIGQPFLTDWQEFTTKYACLQFKTGQGMRKHTNSDKDPIYLLPYWGAAEGLTKKYLWT